MSLVDSRDRLPPKSRLNAPIGGSAAAGRASPARDANRTANRARRVGMTSSSLRGPVPPLGGGALAACAVVVRAPPGAIKPGKRYTGISPMDLLLPAMLLGAVQGLTEFLPVSSTAHLDIIPQLAGWHHPLLNSQAFDVALHLGTLAALLWVYGGTWLGILGDLREPGTAAGRFGWG